MKKLFRRRVQTPSPVTTQPVKPDDGSARAVTTNPAAINAQDNPGIMATPARDGHVPWSLTLSWQGCAATTEDAEREAKEVGRRVAAALGVNANFTWNGKHAR